MSFITRTLPTPQRRPPALKSPRRAPQLSAGRRLRKVSIAVGLALTLSAPVLPVHAHPPPAIHASRGTTTPASRRGRALLLATPSISPSHSAPAGHEPLGQRVAARLRARGISDEVAVLLVSGLPGLELRGGIPVGFLLGLPPHTTFALAVLGNMLPILPALYLLRLPLVQALAAHFLSRARRKAESIGDARSRAAALALFVGVPLPGTGAWTGCIVGFVLGMTLWDTFWANLMGVLVAGVIVTVLCAMGKTGALIAAAALIGGGLVSVLRIGGAEEALPAEEEGA